MKNSLFFTFLFVTLFSFSQNNSGEKKVKLEIRTANTDNEIHRITNEHTSERINLRKEDLKDHTHKPGLQRHNRPHLDGKMSDKKSNNDIKKEQHPEKKHEHRQDKQHHQKERRENKGK